MTPGRGGAPEPPKPGAAEHKEAKKVKKAARKTRGSFIVFLDPVRRLPLDEEAEGFLQAAPAIDSSKFWMNTELMRWRKRNRVKRAVQVKMFDTFTLD